MRCRQGARPLAFLHRSTRGEALRPPKQLDLEKRHPISVVRTCATAPAHIGAMASPWRRPVGPQSHSRADVGAAFRIDRRDPCRLPLGLFSGLCVRRCCLLVPVVSPDTGAQCAIAAFPRLLPQGPGGPNKMRRNFAMFGVVVNNLFLDTSFRIQASGASQPPPPPSRR